MNEGSNGTHIGGEQGKSNSTEPTVSGASPSRVLEGEVTKNLAAEGSCTSELLDLSNGRGRIIAHIALRSSLGVALMY